MLDTWETLLWVALLTFVSLFVLAASMKDPSSLCRSCLAALRSRLAAQGVSRGGGGGGWGGYYPGGEVVGGYMEARRW